MRIDQSWTLSYLDVDESFQLKPVALIRRMEEAAIRHTELVGLPAKDLFDRQGLAWMMHKIGLKIHHLPVYGQELTVSTWSKGIKGFRALREFEVKESERVLVSATSLWLLYDLSAARLTRIPREMAAAYEIESRQALNWDLAKWKPENGFAVQSTVPITTRASDFDIYGHVNHALYLDYIDTALTWAQGTHIWEGEIKVAFLRQISRPIEQIEIHLGSDGQAGKLSISSDDTLFALAEHSFGRDWKSG
jgi:acyl-ACP thioesterase